MDHQPVISVIVPIHKVEPYLDRCVQSIVDQTYRNMEIILVDDGSPDSCPAMCDAWAEKDSRIKVIHKPNGGLSDARNAGMAIATGEYIGFVDSDDHIAPEMYQLLYERMIVDGSDISACGVEMEFEDGTEPRMLTKSGNCVLGQEEAMRAIITESWLKQPVWYKLYKTARIRDIPFPVGKYHEDVFWSYQAIARAQKVSVFDTPCYFYVQRSGSIMGNAYSLKRLDAMEAKVRRLGFLEKYFPSMVSVARIDLLFSCMYHGQQAQKHLAPEQKTIALYRLRETVAATPLPEKPEFQALPITLRIWLRIAKLNLPASCWLRNVLNIGC